MRTSKAVVDTQRATVRAIVPGVLLLLATVAVYWQVHRHEFLAYDDNAYVTENPHVQSGLGAETFVWAFTATREGNWHPLTWLSHALDCSLFGADPAGHHLMNLAFHLASTLLLLLVFTTMTGEPLKSAFVAGLFALHPLHVESVAWAAERKDVLSTFFWMLTLAAYVGYSRRPGPARYALVASSFILGLLAKPMLVTLPFVLLLLDYWPLRRWRAPSGRGGSSPPASLLTLILEKIPLLVIAAVSAVVTLVVQRRGGAMTGLDLLPMGARFANALVAYSVYLLRAVWPTGLAVLYPLRKALPSWEVITAGVVLAAITFAVTKLRRRAPFLAVGWLWYLGTLVPVLGLVQVGVQATADRYTYVPLTGVFLMVAWGAPEMLRGRASRFLTASLAGLALLGCAWLTSRQVGYWKDSVTLFEHALAVTRDNYVIHNNLGGVLFRRGRIDDAITHFTAARRIRSDYTEAMSNLGLALQSRGRLDEAIDLYREAVRIRPSHLEAWFNLASALAKRGELDEAASCYRKALDLSGGNPEIAERLRSVTQRLQERAAVHAPTSAGAANGDAAAQYDLGNKLRDQGKLDEAAAHYREAVRLDPGFARAFNNLGSVLARLGRTDEAVAELTRAVELVPGFEAARNNLGIVLALQGKFREASDQFSEVLRLDPGDPSAHYNLGRLLGRQGRWDEAIGHFEAALRTDPGHRKARMALEQARTHTRRNPEDAAKP